MSTLPVDGNQNLFQERRYLGNHFLLAQPTNACHLDVADAASDSHGQSKQLPASCIDLSQPQCRSGIARLPWLRQAGPCRLDLPAQLGLAVCVAWRKMERNDKFCAGLTRDAARLPRGEMMLSGGMIGILVEKHAFDEKLAW